MIEFTLTKAIKIYNFADDILVDVEELYVSLRLWLVIWVL